LPARIFTGESSAPSQGTHNSGVERFATEIVLTPYRGELVLLDSKGEQQSAQPNGGGRAPARTAPRSHSDMDDAIPF